MRMMKKMVRLTFMSLPLAIMPIFTAFFARCTTACDQPCRYHPPHPPTHPPAQQQNAQKRRKTEVNTRRLDARLATTTTNCTTTESPGPQTTSTPAPPQATKDDQGGDPPPLLRGVWLFGGGGGFTNQELALKHSRLSFCRGENLKGKSTHKMLRYYYFTLHKPEIHELRVNAKVLPRKHGLRKPLALKLFCRV